MSDDSARTEAARAYAAHYSERDSRTQIQNIVSTPVPAQEILDARTELALARLERPTPV